MSETPQNSSEVPKSDATAVKPQPWYKSVQTALVAGAAVIGGVALLLGNVKAITDYFSHPSAHITIDDVDIADGDYDQSVILTVRNVGNATAVLTGARVIVHNLYTMPQNVAFMRLDNSATYIVELEPQHASQPEKRFVFPVNQLSQQVKPDDPDRFTIRFSSNGDDHRFPMCCCFSIELDYNGTMTSETEQFLMCTARNISIEGGSPIAKTLASEIGKLKAKRTPSAEKMLTELVTAKP